MMRFGTVLILRGGQKRIISFDADVKYDERKITKVEFDRNGEVANVSIFKKARY